MIEDFEPFANSDCNDNLHTCVYVLAAVDNYVGYTTARISYVARWFDVNAQCVLLDAVDVVAVCQHVEDGVV